MPKQKHNVQCLDFSKDEIDGLWKQQLSELIKTNRGNWVKEFCEWTAELNKKNNCLSWWAHTSAARNVLSSPFGDRFFEVKAVEKYLEHNPDLDLTIKGMSLGQLACLQSYGSRIAGKKIADGFYGVYGGKLKEFLSSFVRIQYQWLRVFAFFVFRGANTKVRKGKHCVFTYIDAECKNNRDNYFGDLYETISSRSQDCLYYLAFVYMPLIDQVETYQAGKAPYLMLFDYLKIPDFFLAFEATLKELVTVLFVTDKIKSSRKRYSPLLQEILLHDITHGGYVHHMLAYHAIRRFVARHKPSSFVYPYENKSLEKIIIRAIRDCDKSDTMIIGYQHTSITPRHFTMLFEPGEASFTPLPDKIITAGQVVRNYLEEYGNYPKDIFITGGALRQTWGEAFPRNDTAIPKLLVALSSSQYELMQAIIFFQKLERLMPEIELGIRPHNNFPISSLPEKYRNWVENYATDLSGTLLLENLEWCDITAYVSSTVCLESLIRGKPIVNFSINELFSSDPILDDIEFYWRAESPDDMSNIVREVKSLGDADYIRARESARKYVSEYLRPVDDEFLSNFY